MAAGRRDYTWGFLNESAVEGRYSEIFSASFDEVIPAFDWAIVYTYTVPEGYRVGITKILVSSNSGIYNNFWMLKNGVEIFIHLFTGLQIFDFSEHSTIYFNAGEVFAIAIDNTDEITIGFFGSIFGVKESVI
jgi:hypothetical protein